MKKLLSLLSATPLFCFNYAAGDLASSADSLVRAPHGAFSEERKSAEELKVFLETQWYLAYPPATFHRPFQEEAFAQFCTPFSEGYKRLTRLEQLRAWARASCVLKDISVIAYDSFTQAIDGNKKALSISGIEGFTVASRIETLDYYRLHIHPYFLKFQQMFMEILEHAARSDLQAQAILRTPFGTSSDYQIAWLRDRNGIVPTPLKGGLKKILHYSPMPYGDWGDEFQRTMMFNRGTHITSPGIFVLTERGSEVFKFVLENGERGAFITSPYTARTNASDSKIREILSLLEPVAHDRLGTFIPLPSNPEEEKEFEALFLEDLLHEKDAFSMAFIGSYAQSIDLIAEAEEPFASALTTGRTGDAAIKDLDSAGLAISSEKKLSGWSPSGYCDGAGGAGGDGASPLERSSFLPGVATALESHINSLLEDQIRKEQEAISKSVAEGAVIGRLKTKPSKKGKAAAVHKAETVALPAESHEALKAEILSTIKERGRAKWRTLIRVLRTALTDAYKGRALSINASTRGSHLAIHLHSASESDGITIIRPHGRSDRTISAGEARGLARQLIDITFNLMRR